MSGGVGLGVGGQGLLVEVHAEDHGFGAGCETRWAYLFERSEVLSEKSDRILGPADTKLDNAVLQYLLDVMMLHVGLTLA